MTSHTNRIEVQRITNGYLYRDLTHDTTHYYSDLLDVTERILGEMTEK